MVPVLGLRMNGYTVTAALFVILRVFRGTVLPSASVPYVKICLVIEPGAAGSGSKGVPGGITGSVAARASGTDKKTAVRIATIRTIDGLIRRLDLRRGVFIKEKQGSDDSDDGLVQLSIASNVIETHEHAGDFRMV